MLGFTANTNRIYKCVRMEILTFTTTVHLSAWIYTHIYNTVLG